MNRKLSPAVWILAAVGLALTLAAAAAYTAYVAPTRIALVNLRDFQVADLLDAARGRRCDVERLDLEALPDARLTRFDAILVFAHGLTVAPGQRAALDAAAAAGVVVVSFGETMAENELDTLEDPARAAVDAYLDSWSPANIAGLLEHIRRELDGKRLFAPAPQAAVEQPRDGFFHPTTDVVFETIGDYDRHYRSIGAEKSGAPRVALLSMVSRTRSSGRAVLDAIVHDLEGRDLNVVPIAGFRKRLELLEEAAPDLVVALPHGRLAPGRGDAGVSLLRELDVPLLSPVTADKQYDEWIEDQRGLTGGLLSQSVIMPELDGAIDALAVGALFQQEDGLAVLRPLEDRVGRLGERVTRWLALRHKPNADKRVAIVYYKAPGQNALVASGLDVGGSLLALLHELRRQGYDTGTLPATSAELLELIQRSGPLVASYAKGRFEQLLDEGDPVRLAVGMYESWRRQSLPAELNQAVDATFGPPPGNWMVARDGDSAALVVPRLRFGKVVLLPQPLPAPTGDESRAIHGLRQPPAHPYVATYLWLRHGFEADVLVHFGTHGSLEFTPRKQVGLSHLDWPDALVGPLPHVYLYSVADIGEAIIAKRRGYGSLISHLTPPFGEADLEDEYAILNDRISAVTMDLSDELREQYLRHVTAEVLRLAVDRDLGLDGLRDRVLSMDELDVVRGYIHQLDHARITKGLHTLGQEHATSEVDDTVRLIVIDRLTDLVRRRDEARSAGGTASARVGDGPAHHLRVDVEGEAGALDADPAARATHMVDAVLRGDRSPASFLGDAERALLADDAAREGPEAAARTLASALLETLETVPRLREALRVSPQRELAAFVGAFSGRRTEPSSGGDPIGNPASIPTGRNMYGVQTERTPTEVAWESGKSLADELLARRVAELGRFPEKVAFTLWAGEFVRSEGANVAQILHLLGVEPVRNSLGNVFDIRLIPADELGRPRVDVVVQTSGQFRDLAASRISLIDRAVRLAASAADDERWPNFVRTGSQAAEAAMKRRGVAPAEARRLATARVFGGIDGDYGTRIMGMVEDGDSWQDESEIGTRYLANMGALYTEDSWALAVPGAFEGALANTDTVVLGRTSNTWGPISLDHVYEFVGGLSAAVREVTGERPAAYFTDMRNRYRPTVQTAREAVWSESRTTLLNDAYVAALIEDGPSAAEVFAEAFRNTFGWNATRPQDVDPELWDRLHDVYVEDALDLGVRAFFDSHNPYALQEMSAVLLESHRKGYWQPGDAVIRKLSELHATLVADHGAGCSGFVCDNAALRESVAERLDHALRNAYDANLDRALEASSAATAEGMSLEKETLELATVTTLLRERLRGVLVLGVLAVTVAALLWVGARGRRRGSDA